MDLLNIATLSNCTVTSQNLHKATLSNCTLRNVELHNSTVTGSTLRNCRLYDCTIHTSKLHKSFIFGAKAMLKCQLNDTEICASLPELKKFSVEVREMIFHEVLEGCWNGKAPGLLVALRGHPDLYFEALAIFRKVNTFMLDWNSRYIFERMTNSALAGITNLEIDARRGQESCLIQLLSNVKKLVALHIRIFAFKVSKSVFSPKTVQEAWASPQEFNFYPRTCVSELISVMRAHCGRLQSLTLSFSNCLGLQHMNTCLDNVALLDERSNISGVQVGESTEEFRAHTWVWKAEAGRVLEWRSK